MNLTIKNKILRYTYLPGLIIPDASLRIRSFAFSEKLIPIEARSDSAIFLAVFVNVGSALSPT